MSLFTHSAFKDFERTFLLSIMGDDAIIIAAVAKYVITKAMELPKENLDIATSQSDFLDTLDILPLLEASFVQVKGTLGMAIIMDTLLEDAEIIGDHIMVMEEVFVWVMVFKLGAEGKTMLRVEGVEALKASIALVIFLECLSEILNFD
jgi:hypothetical protein